MKRTFSEMTKAQLMERGKGRCCMCHKIKPLLEMTKDGDRPPSRCKKCGVIYLTKLMSSNPDAYANALRLNREYYYRNREVLIAKSAARSKERYRTDPEFRKRVLGYQKNRQLSKSGILFELAKEGKGRCHVCKEIKSLPEMSKRGTKLRPNICKLCKNAQVRKRKIKATNDKS
jgi:hypothetical protein